MNILVIGGGIFGTVISLVLSEDKNNNVTLVEETNDILNKASKCNHNRLHLGFHYPRSIETAKQSLTGMISFFINFKDAINTSFNNYYIIEKNGKVTEKEFINFCDELNIFYKEEWPKVELNRENLSVSLLTQEPIFDYTLIKNILNLKLKNSKVNLTLNKKIKTKNDCENYDVVINTTYANLNEINDIFNIQCIKLKLQDVVIPIIELEIPPIGLTIMDGPYCSLMPMGFNKNKFLLYHVKESVLDQQLDNYYKDNNKIFNYQKILNESKKYYSFLSSEKYIDCYRTIRALPINDNDERLSIHSLHEINNKKIINVISGKISTCWSTAYELKKLLK
jgi:hypothetical protein